MALSRSRVPAACAAAAVALLTLGSCALLSDELTPSASPFPTSSTSPSATAQADGDREAVITVAGIDVDGRNVSASGYVSGIVEDGGNCLYTFTGITGEVTVESSGIADVVTTSCGSFRRQQSPSFAAVGP